MNKFVMIVVAFIGLAVSTPKTVKAQYYSTGSYVQRGNYWYNSAGAAFTRVKERCRLADGCWGWCWKYNPVTIDPQVDGATEKLLEIVQERDRWEGKLRVETNRHNMFIEKLKELGLEKNFTWDGYGYQLRMSNPYVDQGYNQSYSQLNYPPTYAQQGSTAWGMSQFTSPYGNVDMTLAQKQAADLTKNAQQLAGQGHSNFMEYVTTMSDAQARVAELQAKTELLRAAEPKPGQPVIQRYSFSASQNAEGQLNVEQQTAGAEPQGPIADMLKTVIQNRCISCHGSARKKGNVDMSKFLVFSKDQQKRVLEVITSCDPGARMPFKPSPDGSGHVPGEPLTIDEIRLFFLNAK